MRPIAAGLFTLALLAAAPADASEKLEWKKEWPRFRTSEYVTTTVAGAGVATFYLLLRRTPTWGHPILFDETFRDAFRSDSPATLDAWQKWGTYAYLAMMIYPVAVDSVTVPLARGSKTVAWQTTWINLQALAISGFVFRITEFTVARARPHIYACKQKEGSYEACRESGLDATNSFVGGHVAMAATGAALMCTHHAYLRLYGGAWDAIACGAGIALTGAVTVSRLVTDNHYMTDNVAGMVLGALSGWLMPTLLHYGFDGKGSGASAALRYAPVPMATATSMGVAWSAVL